MTSLPIPEMAKTSDEIIIATHHCRHDVAHTRGRMKRETSWMEKKRAPFSRNSLLFHAEMPGENKNGEERDLARNGTPRRSVIPSDAEMPGVARVLAIKARDGERTNASTYPGHSAAIHQT